MRNCAAFNLIFPCIVVIGLIAAVLTPLLLRLKEQKHPIKHYSLQTIPFDILTEFTSDTSIDIPRIQNDEKCLQGPYTSEELTAYIAQQKKFHYLDRTLVKKISEFSDTGKFFGWLGLRIDSISTETDHVKMTGRRNPRYYSIVIMDKRHIDSMDTYYLFDEKGDEHGAIMLTGKSEIKFGAPAW